jgi:anti-sigma regulatory factor (Ser/Thr protein kinase)
MLEVALLLVSELVTNCVRHARMTADDPLRLSASPDTTSLRLALRDNGTEGTVARRAPGPDGATGGFALDLVARLSSARGSARDSHGTTVWLELSIPADATA